MTACMRCVWTHNNYVKRNFNIHVEMCISTDEIESCRDTCTDGSVSFIDSDACPDKLDSRLYSPTAPGELYDDPLSVSDNFDANFGCFEATFCGIFSNSTTKGFPLLLYRIACMAYTYPNRTPIPKKIAPAKNTLPTAMPATTGVPRMFVALSSAIAESGVVVSVLAETGSVLGVSTLMFGVPGVLGVAGVLVAFCVGTDVVSIAVIGKKLE